MEKLKQIFKPGSHKEDEAMYGDNAGQSATATTGTEEHTGRAIGSGTQADSTGFHEPEKKEHGVLRQLLNPDGEKYDEAAYGPPTDGPSGGLGASSTPAGGSGRKASVVDLDNVDQLRTDPEAKKHEHGVLRQIFNPHGHKYDEQAYGTTAKEVNIGQDGVPEHTGDGPAELYTDPKAEKKEHGVLRQILNPGGDKYDETRYGTTAVANAPLDMPTTGTQGDIAGLPAKIEPTAAAENDRGILRQLVNPGGEKYDDVSYGETGVAAPGTTFPNAKEQDSASAMSVKSGKLGPYASNTDSNTVGSEQATSTETSHLGHDAGLGAATAAGVGAAGYEAEKRHGDAATTSTLPASTESTTDRSFPLTGGATTTGSSTYASTELPDRTAQTSTAPGETGVGAVGSTYTARSYPVGGSSVTDSSTHLHPGDELASSGTTAPLPNTSSDTTGTSHLGRDAAVGAGAGAAGVAGLEAYERSLEPKPDVAAATYTYSSQPVGGTVDGAVGGHHDDEEPVPGYVHHTQGPHATDAANLLDPHVPGEFPTEDGEDPHKVANREAAIIDGTGVGMPSIGSAAYTTEKSPEQPPQSTIDQSSAPSTTAGASTAADQSVGTQHHLGSDAAVGAGVAGLGAAGYEASKAGNESAMPSAGHSSTLASQPLGQGAATTSQPTGTSTQAYNTSSSAVPVTTTTTTQAVPASTTTGIQPPVQESSYARDAAVAGGAGVVGAGAYEAAQSRGDTGPASKTIGPHESNIANIVDPRVQPQPEKMKDHTTTGPYQSDTLNKVDPRVQSDPSKAEQQVETHHNRDTAVAGGAAGTGAFETLDRSEASGSSSPSGHNHHKLHKKEDPRGPTGASNVIHDRHEQKLQEAREAEAAKRHEQHEHGDVEKKPSLLKRILHPGHRHDQDSTESSTAMSPQDTATPTSRTQLGNDAYQTPGTATGQAQTGIVTDPHTGLPMNVGQYGSGQGGTDGAANIGGYRESAATGEGSVDWEKIKKANTPY